MAVAIVPLRDCDGTEIGRKDPMWTWCPSISGVMAAGKRELEAIVSGVNAGVVER